MGNRWSDLLCEAIHLMKSGETARARDHLEQLESAAGSNSGAESISLSSVWEPFVYLLGRRGYFVSGPEKIRSALAEILEMGPGFDLYDLSVAIARCDSVLAEHFDTPSSRIFPELRPFLPTLERP